MLAGVETFKGETRIDTLAAILKDDPPTMGRDVPVGLKAIVNKALQKTATTVTRPCTSSSPT